MPKLPKPLLGYICWFVGNFARRKEFPKHIALKVQFIIQAGLYTDDNMIVSDALWALAHLTENASDEIINQAASGEILPKVIEKLDFIVDSFLFVPALKVIGNITTTSSEFVIDKAIFEGLLPKLNALFELKGNHY